MLGGIDDSPFDATGDNSTASPTEGGPLDGEAGPPRCDESGTCRCFDIASLGNTGCTPGSQGEIGPTNQILQALTDIQYTETDTFGLTESGNGPFCLGDSDPVTGWLTSWSDDFDRKRLDTSAALDLSNRWPG